MVNTRCILLLNKAIATLIITFLSLSAVANKDKPSNDGLVIMDITGYPLIFELNEGESHTINRSYSGMDVSRTIRVLSIKHHKETNLWFAEDGPQGNYVEAEIEVDVSGKRVTLLQRPYQSPITVNGLRIYVESTKDWATDAEYAAMDDLSKDVRLSICLENEPWGPKDLLFLLKEYRWRSSVYNNTWSSLVPYNKLYYHRGEDYGAMPDKLDVVAPFDGEIIATPLPNGDGASNAIIIKNQYGIACRFSHMNIESIDRQYTKGTFVKAGTVLAKTGMTWGGRKSQKSDPHIHVNFTYKNATISSFPYLMEAYFRAYEDPVLAVAGGYRFTLVGNKVLLDGSRSLAAIKEEIQSYSWKLHDGSVINNATAELSYKEPGLYTEELMVTSAHGASDRDFLQVRVYDSQRNGRDIGYGWAYYYPIRGIKCDTPVLFWNRLVRTTSPVIIDFGDGTQTEIESEISHAYAQPGNYVVTLRSRGPQNEPLTVKMEVVVEK